MIIMNFKDALKLATEAHEGQVRKYSGLLYITHPMAVADKFEDEHLKILAVLHDVVEDTSVSYFDLFYEHKVPLGIISELSLLTRPNCTYLSYILRIKGNETATKIKIEDIKHNLSDLKDGCLKDKYLMALYILKN